MSRYSLRDGRLRVIMMTVAPADLEAPTIAELAAGVDLRGVENDEALAADGINGWEVNVANDPTPDALSYRTGTIPGEETYAESSLEFWRGTASTVIYDASDPGLSVWVSFVEAASPSAAIAAGNDIDTWPARISTRTKLRALNGPAQFRVNFAPQVPTLDGTVAA
ncbi:MAG TPA: hypothetical protein VGB14_00370 [Acidimicrobiales bacterium]|jgi:hypothetical protein